MYTTTCLYLYVCNHTELDVFVLGCVYMSVCPSVGLSVCMSAFMLCNVVECIYVFGMCMYVCMCKLDMYLFRYVCLHA